MGIDTESDSQKSCNSDLSPNTVLPCRHFPDAEKRRKSSKVARKDDSLTAKEGFTEISFRRYRSSSCKTQSRTVGLGSSSIELRRGSVYQSSREVRKMKKTGGDEGRRKIELSRESETSFSFSVVDSLCSSDEEKRGKKSPALSGNVNSKPTSIRRSCLEPRSSNGFIEISPDLDKREKQSAERVRSDSIENSKLRCEQVVGPVNDANELLEKDMALTFHKSVSAKVEVPYSPSPSESDCSSRGSSKSRFRKMFDPFMKSKSLKSPLGSIISEPCDVKTTGMTNVRKNPISRKSLLPDFSHTAAKSDMDSLLVKKDYHQSAVASSPVHLHGCLKLESNQGVPYLKFSLDCPEEVLIAKTWKGKNAFNWVYTFHSIGSRKKSNAGAWGLTDVNKESSVVAQMQVSCYVCSELKDGVFDDSMLTEFVLYDIAHARQSFTSQDSLDNVKPPNDSGLDNAAEHIGLKNRRKHAPESDAFDSSNPCPWPSAVLHSDLEIAAVVIQLPIDKRESLKHKSGDKSCDRVHSNLLNHSTFEQRRKGTTARESQEKVKVVIPTGNHSLPTDESRGPSSLLDRWRLGGGCDCGGWDMCCPITIFGSPGISCAEDEPLVNNQRPFEILLQGAKQKLPALTMTVVEEGKYAVDFHAQLSTLQAFSICVAVLHRTEASSITSGEERSKQLPHCNSLKVLIEEEVQFLIDAVTEEEKTKKVSKKTEDIQQSYALNPPFSPIARV
ncbi:uncharacterized protein [Euphorbia lathyris]|uniref:uncharacterized protein n=1 Tax=Euphorbia lathyris TaxID=212925 RepID=UPI0033139A4F